MGEGRSDAPRKGPGRPRKFAEDRARQNVTFRMDVTRLEALKHLATKSGRSISEEIEHELNGYWEHVERSVENSKDPAFMIADGMRQALRLAALSSGSQFHETDIGYEAALAAIDGIKALMKPPSGYRERKAAERKTAESEGPMTLASLGSGLGLAGLGQSQEEMRAGAIGWAAATEAVRWARGDDSEGLSTEMLLSRGRMLEGLDRDALLALADKHGLAQKTTNKDDASD